MKLKNRVKRIIGLAVTVALLMSGCGSTKSTDPGAGSTNAGAESTDSQKGSAISDAESPTVLDTSGFMVAYDIHMTSNLLFIPNYYGDVYGVGTEYEDAIDEWIVFHFSEAESMLLDVESAIENADNQYYPDDLAFVKDALGIFYCEMADYEKAYDYLIDAYVTMEELYGSTRDSGRAEQYYPMAIRLALCHYYYETGSYDQCLSEIQSVKDEYEETEALYAGPSYIQLFVTDIRNDIEAKIYQDRGEYKKAAELFSENVDSCAEYIKENEDPTLGYMLLINASIRMADIYKLFYLEEGYADKANGYYDLALKTCERFGDGKLEDRYKSEIQLKKGSFLLNFSDTQEQGWELLTDGYEMQESLYESGESAPNIIDAYITYAEALWAYSEEYEEAASTYEQALSAALAVYGENHPETAKVYESMGRFYGNKLREDDQAISYFEKSIDIYKNLLLENNVQMAATYLQLAGAYKLKGEETLSDDYLDKAYAMYDALGIQIKKADSASQ